ncbi:MAG: ROK family protein [Devosia sp.]|nr:ROK family protein [Devosia sp.]
MTAHSSETVLVIDIGGTQCKFGMVRSGVPGEYSRVFSTQALRDEDPIAALAEMVRTVRGEIGHPVDLVVSTVPGFMEPDYDTVLFAGNILNLNGRRLATELSAIIGLPVLLERDSVLSLMGECAAGAGVGSNHTLGLFFGTGVGGAYIENGMPFRGAGWALEIGHIPFRGEGRRFEGMRTDCLETYVSGRALQLIADRNDVDISEVFAGAATNPKLREDLDEFVRDQAFAVGTAIALFSPATVILGGGVCSMKAFPRDRLEQLIVTNSTADESRRPLDLRWAQLGWKGALFGAFEVVRRNRTTTT